MTWFTRLVSCALAAVLMLLGAVVLTCPEVGGTVRGPRGNVTSYRLLAEETERLGKIQREKREIDAAARRRRHA